MMKLTVACTLTSLMLLCTPVLACGTQLNPLPCDGLEADGRPIYFRASFPAGAVASRPRA